MRNKYYLALLLFLSTQVDAQKLLIDSNAYNKWPNLDAGISNNGKYLYYSVRDPALQQDSLIIQSTDLQWKEVFLDAGPSHFTLDSRMLIFQRHDSIFMISLGNNLVDYLAGVEGKFQHLSSGTTVDLLLFKLRNDPDQLVIKDMNDGEQRKFPAPERYWFDANAKAFIFLTKQKNADNIVYQLQYAKLTTNKISELWQGAKVEKLIFDKDGDQMIFLTGSNGGKSIWHCLLEKQKVVKLVDDTSFSVDSGLKIDDILGLNKEKNKVFFTVVNKVKKALPPLGVDIYSYKDPKLQSQQLHELETNNSRVYKAMVNIADNHVVRLEQENEFITGSYPHSLPNNWALLFKEGKGNHHDEWNWNRDAKASAFLLSLKDGSKRLIYSDFAPYANFVLSPDENYVVFYDPKRSGYCSFEVSTGVINSVTKEIHTKWTEPDRDDEPVGKYMPKSGGIAGFTSDHNYVLIYDRNDLYKVDLTGRKKPVNLTGGYGHAHHIVFQIAEGQDHFTSNEKIILKAFNTDNKDEGFYRIFLDQAKKLDSLTMQPVKLNGPHRAREADAYLVLQEDIKSGFNYAFSIDLRHFILLAHFHPESKYNWLTSELITWRLPNGTTSGILYKPENFDPHEKYPLIIHYYERMSDNLHSFLRPEVSNGNINIPFYVSNGYLVFTPDIHYKIGEPGRSAFNSIVAGAKLLIKRGYIDAKRIGLQGASFGGFETNYIIAHTNIFAAAMADCSMTDFISAYGSIIGDGSSRQRQYELYRDRMGGTLWQIPEKYIENSPVLRANHMNTPLLLVANNNDEDVPHQQGIELFTALRRLGKKAWMLQYDGEGHGIGGSAAMDYTTRVYQFFNYYLKGDLPPKWMTEGVRASMKGIDSGLELDTSGRVP